MRYIILGLLYLLSLVLPGTLFHFWAWSEIKPDLVMLLTIYIALHHRLVPGMVMGFMAGLLQDFFLGRYIGMYSVTLTAVALLSGWLSARWYRENFLLTTLLVFIVTMFGQTMVAFLGLAAGLPWSFAESLRLIFGISLYNAILVPVTYPFIHHSFLHGWLRYRPRYER